MADRSEGDSVTGEERTEAAGGAAVVGACPSECAHRSEYECCLAAVEAVRVPKDRVQGACDISYNLALTHAAKRIERLRDG